MRKLINHLIDIGYSPQQAEELYYLYQSNNDIEGLERHISIKEATEEIL